MKASLRQQADRILSASIQAVLPDAAVIRALEGRSFPGRVILVAAGKAAWQMAKTAYDCLGSQITEGIIITKYGHSKGPVGNLICREAGHPIPDENSFLATEEALRLTRQLSGEDTVLFLLSGGGSSLFESPLIDGSQLQTVTSQLLACGADIREINTIRKRLSAVKGGRFALHCAPARLFSIVLSDIIGDPLDMIASGPACPDSSTCEQALGIVQKYNLSFSSRILSLLEQETPGELTNVTTQITGSVRQLCEAAAAACRELGYEPHILTDQLNGQAREAGSFLASIARTHAGQGGKQAFIAGGETVVTLTGNGKGGRNQELVLAAAAGIEGLENVAIFSIGSDGTDGPTDAAGAYADGTTAALLRKKDIHIHEVLRNNNSYYALEQTQGLIFTGPTGTNVNDVAVLLLDTAV